jgi:hypothetical protein
MAELELQVFPGYDWQDGEKVTYEKLRQTARPVVRSVVDLEVGEFNYFQNGNLYGEEWLTVGPQTVLNGRYAAWARHWWVRPSGGNVQVERSSLVPDNKSFYSLLVTGAAGVTVVNVGQRIERDLAATLRRQVTLSIWLRNDTGASFTPVLKLRTCDAVNDFLQVTERISTALQVCPNTTWTQLVWTADLQAVADLVNGFEVMLEMPSGVLNAASKSVGVARGKLQIGGAATSFVEDRMPRCPGKNLIINGSFNVAQRGVTLGFGTGVRYMADRWAVNSVGSTMAAGLVGFSTGQTEVPGAPRSYHQTAVTSVSGAGNFAVLLQPIEDVRLVSGQTLTLSFWAKADAAKSVSLELVQRFGTGGSPSSDVNTFLGKVNVSTVWQKFTITFEAPSISGKTLGTNGNSHANINFWMDAGSSFNGRTGSLGHQSGQWDFAQVQLEYGAVATDYERVPFALEFLLCQRYYFQWQAIYRGAPVTGQHFCWLPFMTRMRASPTVALASDLGSTATFNGFFNTNVFGTEIAYTKTAANQFVFAQWTANAELIQ